MTDTERDYYEDGRNDALAKADGWGNDYDPPAGIPGGFDITLERAQERYDAGFERGTRDAEDLEKAVA